VNSISKMLDVLVKKIPFKWEVVYGNLVEFYDLNSN
jgi:hypothetical protein